MIVEDQGNVRVVPRARRDLLGEGLWWSQRDDAVYWVDIIGRRLNRLRLADNLVDEWDLPEMTGWVIEREDAPGFVAGTQGGFARITLDPFAVTPWIALEPHLPANRMNDARADRHGAIWAGTMPVACDVPSGSLYRLAPDGSVETIDAGYTITNGPAISVDGRTLYHTDTAARTIYAFDLDEEGRVGARREHIAFAYGWGNPDGMTVDAQGGLWVAQWGAGSISRFDPAGRRDRTIALPASQITNIVFAGQDLDRMFVTSAADGVPDEPLAGALFEVDAGVRGLPPHRYRG